MDPPPLHVVFLPFMAQGHMIQSQTWRDSSPAAASSQRSSPLPSTPLSSPARSAATPNWVFQSKPTLSNSPVQRQGCRKVARTSTPSNPPSSRSRSSSPWSFSSALPRISSGSGGRIASSPTSSSPGLQRPPADSASRGSSSTEPGRSPCLCFTPSNSTRLAAARSGDWSAGVAWRDERSADGERLLCWGRCSLLYWLVSTREEVRERRRNR
ncbi:unnamed protein product [Linum trigynum]|uniref:Uncharacterized protein n=1 Tax=Linum trigynum TaxID=586398 RepID=A0AAV2GMT6_9ROSI